MKAAFLNDEEADTNTVSAEHREIIKPRVRLLKGKPSTYWVFPKGAVVEGDVALHIATSGQGAPLDDECKKACGLTEAQLAERQLDYEMTAKGINDADDRELYKAGVIAGYDANREYVKGPNWSAYQKALGKADEQDDE